MGNLICCNGKEDQKRGSTNVKALLRKTEKPGKRRKRIFDLVLDALKRERREERQRRKREKREDKSVKGKQHTTNSTLLSKKIECQTLNDDDDDDDDVVDDDDDDVGEKKNPEQSVITTDLSLEYEYQDNLSANRSMIWHEIDILSSDIQAKTESEEDDNIALDAKNKGDLDNQFTIISDSGCHIEELVLSNHDNFQFGYGIQCTTTDIYGSSFNNDSANVNTDLSEEGETNTFEVDDTGLVLVDDKTLENRQDTDLKKLLDIEEVPVNERSNTDNDLLPDHEDEIESIYSIESSAVDIVNKVTGEKETQDLDKEITREVIRNDISSEECIDHDESHCDSDGGEIQNTTVVAGSDDLKNEICELNEGPPEVFDKTIEKDNGITETIRKYEDVNPKCDQNDIQYLDNQAADALLENDDTYSSPRSDEKKEFTDDNKSINVLKVHDTDNFTGYNETYLSHYNDDDEPIGDDLALKPIQRSSSMPLKRWGSSYDLVTEKRTRADSRRDINSFKKHLTKLKQIYALSKTRDISLKRHLKRQSTKRSNLKYGVMNLTLNDGPKPQIKEILRLKKDPFNFPPKLRQFTERDRHGSIADLKWSRHMRAEVRRHITMESDEFEELMFLNCNNQTYDSEFDVCDEPRASTPIPDYDESRASTPVPRFGNPGYDFPRSNSPVPDNDFPRAPSPDFKCVQRKTKTIKMHEAMKNLQERYGAGPIRYTRLNTPNRLAPCSRHSRPKPTNHRLDTQSEDRKKAAFQTIARQLEKSFKDAKARRSQETKEQTRNNTSFVGIGRQNSFMNFGDDLSRWDD